MSILTDILPDEWRKRIYVAWALIGLAIGAVQVGFSTAGAEQPVALTVAEAVFAFLAAGLGLTAASNITPSTGRHVAE
jgi:hypothetical protein